MEKKSIIKKKKEKSQSIQKDIPYFFHCMLSSSLAYILS